MSTQEQHVKSGFFKLAVYTPLEHADAVREALAQAGAGHIGHYDFCSFSVRGTGRFRGNAQANPAVGVRHEITAVEEEKIEVIVPERLLKAVLEAVKKVHPYEEIAMDLYKLEDWGAFL